MPYTPAETVTALVEARNRGDIETVLTLCEPNAIVVPQPGIVIRGTAAIREWLTSLIARQPDFHVLGQHMLEGPDTALHCSNWTLDIDTPTGPRLHLAGRSASVLHKQADGTWLVAIENPWGTALLDTPLDTPKP